MKNANAVLSVKFNSTFDPQKLISAFENDLEIFRNVLGLVQKYYVAEENTGAISGIYLFESRAALSAFLNSDLAKNIPSKYGVIPESLRVEQYDIAIVLNEAVLDY